MTNKPTTDRASSYNNLEKMDTFELITKIKTKDRTVPFPIEKTIRSIKKLVDIIYSKMSEGGRLFYIGAGTSGRLEVIDASECPPTYGVSDDRKIGLIAGGDSVIRKAVENAEDILSLVWENQLNYNISDSEVLIGNGSHTII